MKKVNFYFAMLAVLILLSAEVVLSNPTGSVQFSKDDLRFSKDRGYDVVNIKGASFSKKVDRVHF